MGDGSRWRGLFGFLGRDPEAEIEDEISFHIEMRVDDLMRRGLGESEARERARREFGDADRVRRELGEIGRRRVKRERRARVVSEMVADARFGWRSLWREPTYAVTMLATLALVIAAVTTIFSLVDGVLLRPLPYPEPGELAVVWERDVTRGRGENVASVASLEAWRDAGAFEALAGLVPDRTTLRTGRPERVPGAAVSPSWFDAVGVAPALGRGFTAAEAAEGARVVVLGHGLWRSSFGADSTVIGDAVRMGDDVYTVVGVMPEGFEPPAFGWLGADQRYWVPFAPTELNRRWGRFLLVVGRLADGATLESADAEVKAIAARRAREDSDGEGWTADAVGLRTQVTGGVRAPLLVLAVAVAFLLMIGIVNATNLVLARAQRRGAELAVRSALGAPRGRLVRQLFAEGVGIAVVGACIGGLLAVVGVDALAAALPVDVPRGANVELDARALAVAVGAGLLAGLAIGLVPALRAPQDGEAGRLREEGGGRIVAAAGGRRLVVAEVALALVLAVGAGLAARTYVNLRSVPLGFTADDAVALRVALSTDAYDTDRRRIFFDELLDRLGALPGIDAAAAVSARPIGGWGPATRVNRADGPGAEAEGPVTDVRVATPGYFRTLGIRRVAGSGFADGARGDGSTEVVVNETLVRELGLDRFSAGERVVIAFDPPDTAEVVGIVADVRLVDPAVPARATVYYSHAASPSAAMDVIVRGALPAERLATMAREAVWALDPALAVSNVESLDESVGAARAQERINLLLLGGFSVIALLLAAIGIYGVLALEVGARRRELAVRIALGAAPGRVQAGVIGSAVALAGIGVAIGVAAAVGLTRFMEAILHDVEPTDVPTYAGVVALLLATAALAAFRPARRAARVDPIEAMRTE